MEKTLFTIGYATKEIDEFVRLLKKHGVTCLIDVRTSPFSKTFPLYDKPRLKDTLNSEGILYAHFGEEFGARRSENEVYSITYSLKGERKEQVDFDKVYNNPNFQRGVQRVYKALEQGYKVCFMCSEKHPVDCHRFWMVAYYFATLEEPFEITNIVTDEEVQSFKDVLGDVDIVKEKTKFYKQHDELSGFSLIPVEIPTWVQYWDNLFNNEQDEQNLKHKYSNIKIGYAKGGEEND